MKFPHSEELIPSERETSDVRNPLRTCLQELSKHPLMNREEEHEMARRVRMDGDKTAAQRLVLANLRLVVSMALEYHNHPNLLDLIQEGNMGLVHAVGKYDPERGMRFATYATFWIRASMLRYLLGSWSVVRVGTNDTQKRLFYALDREKERLERSGVTPSPEVLADHLAATIVEIEEIERRRYQGDVSLEEPLNTDGETLMDMIGSGEDVEETVIEKDRMESFHRRLDDFRGRLNDKQRLIFDTRIMAEDPLTLEEISGHFNRTRERVRQMETEILKKLARTLRLNQIRPSLLRGGVRHRRGVSARGNERVPHMHSGTMAEGDQ